MIPLVMGGVVATMALIGLVATWIRLVTPSPSIRRCYCARNELRSSCHAASVYSCVACLTNWQTSDHGIWHSRREVGTMMADSGRLCSGSRAFQASEHSIGSWQILRLQSGVPYNSNRSCLAVPNL